MIVSFLWAGNLRVWFMKKQRCERAVCVNCAGLYKCELWWSHLRRSVKCRCRPIFCSLCFVSVRMFFSRFWPIVICYVGMEWKDLILLWHFDKFARRQISQLNFITRTSNLGTRTAFDTIPWKLNGCGKEGAFAN